MIEAATDPMHDTMIIDGCHAVIQYRAEKNLFRGKFTGLNGYADFYASDIEGLQREGRISLAFLAKLCEEDGVPLVPDKAA